MRRCFFQVLQQRKSILLKPLVAPRVYYTTTSVPRRLPVLAERTNSNSSRSPGQESADKRATEIKDAKLIFNQAWKNIEDHYGRENIQLPREFIFLMGAPG